MRLEKVRRTYRARAAFSFGPLSRLLFALLAAAFALTAPAAAPAQQPAPTVARARSEAKTLGGESAAIRRFHFKASPEALDDLRRVGRGGARGGWAVRPDGVRSVRLRRSAA
jgi:hypothetical protein